MIRRQLCAEIAPVGRVMAVAMAMCMAAGCGSSDPSDTPKTEAQLADAKKIQELSKQGYDFADIRES